MSRLPLAVATRSISQTHPISDSTSQTPPDRASTGRRRVGSRIGALVAVTLAVAGTMLVVSTPANAMTTAEASRSKAVYALLNAQRGANHLPALGASTALTVSARRHNLTMSAQNTMAHQLPGEASPGARISAAGVAWHAMAENIAWTSDFSQAGAMHMQNVMYAEQAPNDGHRQNILSRSTRFVGIDVLLDSRTGKLWITEDFADTPGPAPVDPHAPVGHFDQALVLPGHRVQVRGWALDPDSNATPLSIAVYDEHGHGLANFMAGTSRPDVVAVWHSGPNQGFQPVISAPAGRHAVCAIAYNMGPGPAFSPLGCQTVVI